MKTKIDERVVCVGEEEPKKEMVIMIMKGENEMKRSVKDYIKLGFGFYIGYNIARILKHALVKKIEK